MDSVTAPEIHTSASLKKDHIKILQVSAGQYNISINDLMILLLRIVIKKKIRFIVKMRKLSIQYQESGSDYRVINLYLDKRDYEVFITARRFYKYSVSWLLGYAIDNFLDDVLAKIGEAKVYGLKILNNYLNFHVFSIKKNRKSIRFRSVIRPYT